jgi:integrase
MPDMRTRWPGVSIRHRKGCPALKGSRCRCEPGYIARVWDPRRRRPAHSPVLHAPAEAVNWKQDTLSALRAGAELAREGIYVADANTRFLAAIRDGSALNKKGRPYKQSAIRTIEDAIRNHVTTELGEMLLGDVRRGHVQALVDEMVASELSGSRVRNVLNALRSLYTYAIARDMVDESPISSIQLPAMNEQPRDRIAAPTEFRDLLAVLTPQDAIPFALAAYASARSQEIRSLTWPAIGWRQGLVTLAEDPNYAKSDAAHRSFPLISQLKQLLQQEWQRQGRPDGQALVCPGHKPGGENSGMLSISALYTRADETWETAKLKPIRLQESRHTAASWMRAAGIDLKLRSTLMGHASTASTDGGRGSITDDRYTHVMPGEIEQAGKALSTYLRKQTTRRAR